MTRRSTLIAVAAITLLALILRLHNLTYHSLWFDEAVSARWAGSSVARILEVGLTLVEDRLPPLYYLALRGWTRLFGEGELALRLLSVALGVILIPLLFATGSLLFNRPVALLFALLAALNPFLIWYSQEARMYALAAVWGAAGVWFFLKALGMKDEGGRRKEERFARKAKIFDPSPFTLHPSSLWWVGFGFCALAGLYTHLYTGFLWPAVALWLLLTGRRYRRAWTPFALTMGLVTLLFLPLALAIWRFSGEASPGNPLDGVAGRMWWLLTVFATWKVPLPNWLAALLPGLMAGLALLGLGQGWVWAGAGAGRPGGAQFPVRDAVLLVVLLFLTPFAIASLLLLRNHLAFFGARYFIVMTPWLLLAAAVGAVSLGRWWRPLALGGAGAVALASLLPLPGLWTPGTAKEAWRQTTAYLAEHARPADAILIHPDWTRFAFQYYYRGPGQTRAAFSAVEATTELDGPLNGVVADHPLVWLVQSHEVEPDPEHRVEAWFAARYPLVTELYPPGLSLKAYAPGYRLSELPPGSQPLEVGFETGLTLQGYEVWDTALPATDDLFHPPSNWVHVVLYWTAREDLDQAYTTFIHLVDEGGGVWGDSDPLARPTGALRLYPPPAWQPGQIIRQDVDVNLNPATPPGSYQLVAGLRDENGHQLDTLEGQPQLPLRSIQILP